MTKQPFYLILLLAISLFTSSCTGINGEGEVIVKNKSIPEKYKGIVLSIDAEVYIRQGNETSITVHGQQNIIDVLELEVIKNKLYIGFTENNVRNYETLKIYLTAESLEYLGINSSGKIFAADSINTDFMEMHISGSGDIKVDKLRATSKINANISGSGTITVAGSTQYAEYRISGSGDIHAFNMFSRYTDAHISGSGNIENTVSDKLDAHISGSGDIRYKGRPQVNSNISGSGNVTHVD